MSNVDQPVHPPPTGMGNGGNVQAPKRLEEGGRAIREALHYAAIVESSDDAILSKDLDGVILSWNRGAERLFGYSAAEAIGQPVTLIIPRERHEEEPKILDTIRRGEPIHHFETVRQHKHGNLIDISLTVSPIRNARGEIIGASKIARDITELKRARDRQQLLLREMSHRVKNLFALSSSIVGLSARSAHSVQELADAARERLAALARAHALTFAHGVVESSDHPATLQSLIRTIVAPFDGQGQDGRSRIAVSGADLPVASGSVASLALLIHEFATNAAKYGALSTEVGTIDVVSVEDGEQVALNWTERGGPPVVQPAAGREGFGGVLSRIAVEKQLGGELSREWKPDGLSIRLIVPMSSLTG
ncbi:PAS domain S-box protein [Roseiarcus sp.]|uniref:PAS domain S-box protein n=1 Tax=Roseiarcus sp. TaxID=1969460 RepID=UPI003F9652FA